MKPGRELDALVAEKVMDNEIQRYVRGTLPCLFSNLPHYSTDIKAAWEVVEKMKKQSKILIEVLHLCYTIQTFNSENQITWTKSEISPAHAICLAALKAKGVECET